MSDENRKLLSAVYDAVNRQDAGRLRELLAPDFVDHDTSVPPGLPEGREGVVVWTEAMWRAMPDLHMEVLDLMVDGDRVVARTRMTGTHTGDLMGMPPTGRSVSFETIDIVRVRDGVAVEHWGVSDTARFMVQLGLAPAEGVVETVQEVYAAFGRGDVPAIIERMADDVRWEDGAVDHGVPWLRPGQGREAVARFFQALGEHLDITRFEVRSLLGAGDQVAAVIDIEASAKSSGRDLSDRSEVHLWTVADGQVTAFRHYVDTHRHVLAVE